MSDTPRHVHFVAIAGTGMGSLAGLLQARGLRVTGSDDQLYPPMSTLLEQWQIPVHESFRAEHVLDPTPDLVVIGNAVREDNPEARAAIDEGLPYRSFSDALYELAMAGKHSVVVSGTHGKTTTTSLVSYLLMATGRDPSMLVGGFAHDFDGSFREGQGRHFVVEGDEYDTAFFDKTPKFLHYHPHTLILTSVEFDHADIYRDLDHVKRAFRELVASMPAEGTIVAATGHEHVEDVVQDAPCRVVRYGVAEEDPTLDWRAHSLVPGEGGTRFTVVRREGPMASVETSMFGAHNVENVLAALATCEVLGVPLEESAAALPAFRGIKRRLEERGEADGVLVLDDFAHHPTAVEATVAAAKARYLGRRIVAVFEPRTNTSRRTVFQQAYAEAFDEADALVICRVPETPIYSNTGEVAEFFSADQLAADVSARGTPAEAFEDVDAIVAHLGAEARSGDVLLVMSNGAFGGIWGKLLDALAARSG